MQIRKKQWQHRKHQEALQHHSNNSIMDVIWSLHWQCDIAPISPSLRDPGCTTMVAACRPSHHNAASPRFLQAPRGDAFVPGAAQCPVSLAWECGSQVMLSKEMISPPSGAPKLDERMGTKADVSKARVAWSRSSSCLPAKPTSSYRASWSKRTECGSS